MEGAITTYKKRILAYLSTMPGEPVTLKELSRHLKTRATDEFQKLRAALDELVRSGDLEKDDRGRIAYHPARRRKARPRAEEEEE